MQNDPLCYLNGEYGPLSQAKISVLDRGFIFGDGVYEVIPVYAGRPFRLPHHLARLQNSLDAIRIDNPLSEPEWDKVIQHITKTNGDGDQSVYVQVTRGVARRDHSFPDNTPPTVFVMSSELVAPSRDQVEQGIEAITLQDIRWLNCHIKAISLLPNVLFRQAAIDAGANEAILLREGQATEGAASNLFLVKDGVIITPPKSSKLLPGITRDLMVEMAHQHGLPLQERDIDEAELRGADEIWITSSTKEVMPVLRLDGEPVGTGTPGPFWQTVYELYQGLKQDLRSGRAS
ncbi:MAG: D-amino acid aminotransferase [Gammaproteobacteria bacterium]|nr:D-amino acid aminotransferase [Gammaproteobacteria bacterium]